MSDMAPRFDHAGERSTIVREYAFKKFVISKQGLVHFTCDVFRKRIKNKDS